MKLVKLTVQLVDFEGIPADTHLRSTYFVTLDPFRIHEKTVAVGTRTGEAPIKNERTKITTAEFQHVTIVTDEGTTSETHARLLPDPLHHAGLPGIEPVFTFEWYRGDLGDERVPTDRVHSEGGGARRIVPTLMTNLETAIGKLQVCEFPDADTKEFSGLVLPNAHAMWTRLYDRVREERAYNW